MKQLNIRYCWAETGGVPELRPAEVIDVFVVQGHTLYAHKTLHKNGFTVSEESSGGAVFVGEEKDSLKTVVKKALARIEQFDKDYPHLSFLHVSERFKNSVAQKQHLIPLTQIILLNL